MALTETELIAAIRGRNLPDTVAVIATRGGDAVHPALWYRAEPVWSPSWSIIDSSGRTDLVPLWACGTVTVFSAADGTFLEWDAEVDEPWSVYPDFPAAVRALLTDLYEDEVNDTDRRAIAEQLLPLDRVDFALTPEER